MSAEVQGLESFWAWGGHTAAGRCLVAPRFLAARPPPRSLRDGNSGSAGTFALREALQRGCGREEAGAERTLLPSTPSSRHTDNPVSGSAKCSS